MLAHHGPRAKELLAPDLVEGRARVLEHVELIEDDLGGRQRRANRVEIGPVHIGADRGDHRPLARGQIFGEQRRGGRFTPVLAQPDHFAAHDVGQHRPEALPFAALHLVEADVPRPASHACPIPLREKGFFGPARLAPAQWRTAA